MEVGGVDGIPLAESQLVPPSSSGTWSLESNTETALGGWKPATSSRARERIAATSSRDVKSGMTRYPSRSKASSCSLLSDIPPFPTRPCNLTPGY